MTSGVGLAMALLAGHPQNLYYILGFCALMMPVWLWRAAAMACIQSTISRGAQMTGRRMNTA